MESRLRLPPFAVNLICIFCKLISHRVRAPRFGGLCALSVLSAGETEGHVEALSVACLDSGPRSRTEFRKPIFRAHAYAVRRVVISMALTATIYNLDIDLADIDRGMNVATC
jgi:hypothetical protein